MKRPRPEHDPGVEFEPHLRPPAEEPPLAEAGRLLPHDGNPYTPPTGLSASRASAPLEPPPHPELPSVDHTVWDEPSLSEDLAKSKAADNLTYARWLAEHRGTLSRPATWLLTIALGIAAGPLAILGTLFSGGASSVNGLLSVVVFGPLVEEVMKNTAALLVVELRPYWFRSRLQIAVCVLTSGLVFASVENVLYLQVYIESPTPELAHWRWTVCVALHMGCALVAGLGAMRIWRHCMLDGKRPRMTLGAPHLVAAVVLHGAYNFSATLIEVFLAPF